MSNLKMSIRLNPAERDVLVTLYSDRRIAIDRYQNRPHELQELTDSFGALTGRSEAPEDVLHYMRTQRKRGLWPKLGNTALKLRDNLDEMLTHDEVIILVSIYTKLGKAYGKGNDSFAHEPAMLRELEREFEQATERYVYGGHLLAILTSLRKDDNLSRLNLPRHGRDQSFDDFDDVSVV